MSSDEANGPSFSGEQAATAQTALRAALGLPPEQFPLQDFVGMVSDEIEQLRAKGFDDEKIAGLLARATGKPVSADKIAAYYASPEARGR